MKKLIFTTFFTVSLLIGSLVAAAEVSAFTSGIKGAGWTFNTQDEVVINKAIEVAKKTLADDKFRQEAVIRRYNAQLALIGKNSKNISYTELKDLINKAVGPGPRANNLVCQFVFNADRFNSFLGNVANDPEFKNQPYRQRYVLKIMAKPACKIGISDFRNEFKSCINYFKSTKKEKNAGFVSDALEIYKSRITEIKPSDVIEDLKYTKVLIYPNIEKDDAWKAPLVKLELMLKSVQ